MASSLSLTTPNSISASSSESLRQHRSIKTCFLAFDLSKSTQFKTNLSASLRTTHQNPFKSSLRIRCSQTDGNGVPAKRTVLHDLYEKQGQSPWYDNLCRPVTDLIPLIESGVRGVTSNPA
ncbi:transaldolase, partial [Trifolium pratense]